MENKKLDRLFREKAETLEVPPSADAWGKISLQTNSGSNAGILWKVAAAIAVIGSAALVIWKQSEVTMQQAIMDHPVQPVEETTLELYAFELPATVAEEPKEGSEAPKAVSEKPKRSQYVASATSAESEEVPSIERPTLSLSTKKSLVAMEETTVPKIVSPQIVATPEEKEQPAVTIKYYADNSPDTTSEEEKKGLGTLWAKAQTFKPGEFLADLRTAKDDLFRSKKLN